MAFAPSPALRLFLEGDLSLEERTALVQAGAPDLAQAVRDVTHDPGSILALDTEDAVLVVSLLCDPETLGQVAKRDIRYAVHDALGKNSSTPAPSPPTQQDLTKMRQALGDAPTVAELREWIETHSVPSGLLHDWLLSSPDPTFYLGEYAAERLGAFDPMFLFRLQDRPEIMSLEAFVSRVPTKEHDYLFVSLARLQGTLDVAMVELFVAHNRDLPYPGDVSCSYTPAATDILLSSSLPRARAVALTLLPPDAPAHLEIYEELSSSLQADVIVLNENVEHQREYARCINFGVGSKIIHHDPVSLLFSLELDFDSVLNLLRWASADEVINYLTDRSWSSQQVYQVVEQIFSEIPQYASPEDWFERLNEVTYRIPVVDMLVEHTLDLAPGVVSQVSRYGSASGGIVCQQVRSRVRSHCGTDVAAWESVLSLALDWKGTLPELLECSTLTTGGQ